MLKYKVHFEPLPKELEPAENVRKLMSKLVPASEGYCPRCKTKLVFMAMSYMPMADNMTVVLICKKCKAVITGYARDIKVSDEVIVVEGFEVESVEQQE